MLQRNVGRSTDVASSREHCSNAVCLAFDPFAYFISAELQDTSSRTKGYLLQSFSSHCRIVRGVTTGSCANVLVRVFSRDRYQVKRREALGLEAPASKAANAAIGSSSSRKGGEDAEGGAESKQEGKEESKQDGEEKQQEGGGAGMEGESEDGEGKTEEGGRESAGEDETEELRETTLFGVGR